MIILMSTESTGIIFSILLIYIVGLGLLMVGSDED